MHLHQEAAKWNRSRCLSTKLNPKTIGSNNAWCGQCVCDAIAAVAQQGIIVQATGHLTASILM
ncbi:hypothetical protein [Aporhodopirellula aestuarii]|uniref:Uncharacterized protein n=1 Tax=Aporhodopirellula aestuarii TaxID=2950107 RepID=A0ABT0U9L2_9BACT|nr:hypothetical protein [Aporhodopirellula aestuarii]MCM2373461.1 hypothetical protein [Aporhodopirellula aestuarii]